MEAIQNKVATLKTEMLTEMAQSLVDDMRNEADVVLNAVMNELEARMSEKDFVSFCETL